LITRDRVTFLKSKESEKEVLVVQSLFVLKIADDFKRKLIFIKIDNEVALKSVERNYFETLKILIQANYSQ
jgi:hypothetical protein